MKRRPLALIGSLLAALAAAPAIVRAGDDRPLPEAKAPAKQGFKVVFKTRIPAPPEGAKRLEAWIPTPYVDAGVQAVTDLKVEASVAFDVTRDEATANRFVHAVVENPKGETTIDWTAVVERSVDTGQGSAPVLDAHLKSDSLAPVDGRARKLAEDLGVVDASRPVRDRARAIYDHVLQSMTYDKETPGWGKGDFERACEVGKGNCSDFAAKFIAIARAAGIPARWSSSLSLAAEHTDCAACGYHCFAHFRDGDRWIPVDPSDARRAVAKDPKRAAWYFGHAASNSIVLSVGRDLVLAPKQQAGAVNFLSGPYVEVDGKPFDVPSKNRTYGSDPVEPATAPAPAPTAPTTK